MKKLEQVIAWYILISVIIGIFQIILGLFNLIELSALNALLYFIAPPILLLLFFFASDEVSNKIDPKK